MITKTKTIKMKFKTWRKIRGLIPGKRGESFSAYIDRVAEDIEKYQGMILRNIKEDRGGEWD